MKWNNSAPDYVKYCNEKQKLSVTIKESHWDLKDNEIIRHKFIKSSLLFVPVIKDQRYFLHARS